MSRSSRRRGQVEPLAAIAAVFAVCVGVSLYAVAAVETDDRPRDGAIAEPTLGRVLAEVANGGAVAPDDVEEGIGTAPAGYSLRIELVVDGRTWTAGPASPPNAERASRPVSARIAPGVVRPGRLVVEVWP